MSGSYLRSHSKQPFMLTSLGVRLGGVSCGRGGALSRNHGRSHGRYTSLLCGWQCPGESGDCFGVRRPKR